MIHHDQLKATGPLNPRHGTVGPGGCIAACCCSNVQGYVNKPAVAAQTPQHRHKSMETGDLRFIMFHCNIRENRLMFWTTRPLLQNRQASLRTNSSRSQVVFTSFSARCRSWTLWRGFTSWTGLENRVSGMLFGKQKSLPSSVSSLLEMLNWSFTENSLFDRVRPQYPKLCSHIDTDRVVTGREAIHWLQHFARVLIYIYMTVCQNVCSRFCW